MTLSKPEPGEQFGNAWHTGPLTYIGALSNGQWLMETADGSVVEFAQRAAATDLYPYLEPVEPLEPGQRFQRTRHDYTGQIAEVLAVFKGKPTHNSAGEVFDPLWVAYHVHYGNGDHVPKLKDEISFRKIFGKVAAS